MGFYGNKYERGSELICVRFASFLDGVVKCGKSIVVSHQTDSQVYFVTDSSRLTIGNKTDFCLDMETVDRFFIDRKNLHKLRKEKLEKIDGGR